MKTKRKGMSLIVLIITVIVIIILAAVVILTISKNNPIESAREATFKEDVRNFQTALALSVSKDSVKKHINRNEKFNATEYDKIKEYIPSFTKKYDGKFIIKDDELLYLNTVTEIELKWLTDLGLKANEKTAAQKISENPSEYYGEFVTNYITGNSNIDDNTKWKIFYSDTKNVYLIAADYIRDFNVPSVKRTDSQGKVTEYKPYANGWYKIAPTVIEAYKGSEDITDSKLQALNSSYFEYLSQNNIISENDNMKAVAYIMDKEAWKSFAGEKAEYAIGSPTIEIFLNSYKEKYSNETALYYIETDSARGYKISKDGKNTWPMASIGLPVNDDTYTIKDTDKASNMWLASPYAFAGDSGLIVISADNCFSYCTYTNGTVGFRPLVCLKSEISLKEVEGGYQIQ